ncbi:MAG: FtsX-like permease family protein [Bradymonadia bacterium]
MKLGSLTSLILQNVKRSKKNLVMSCFGIIVGISTFVFFIGLAEGVKSVVLGEVFIIDQVEVTPKTFDTGFGQLAGGRTLDDAAAKEFANYDGVQAVYPKMKFTFPTRGYGGKALFKKNLYAEIIADGLNEKLIQAEDETGLTAFTDRDADLNELRASCTEDAQCGSGLCKFGRCRTACNDKNTCTDGLSCLEGACVFACTEDAQCGAGRTCQSGVCRRSQCEFSESTKLSVCPGDSYCAEDTNLCEAPIPFVVSHHLLELYNGSLATALSGQGGSAKMPKLSKSMVVGFQLNTTFGKSMLGRRFTARKAKPITRRIKLVGFSDKAIALGITIPLEYVRRLNARFSGIEAAETYHSMILKVADQTQVPQIVNQIHSQGFALADSTTRAEQAANILRTVESVFALISLVIVGIAAVNISQMFFMLIYQRKRELGLFRALGGSKADVRRIIMGEAALIGLLGGVLGCLAGFGASKLVDFLARQAPEFPYKPESFFAFPTWVWPAAIGVAVLFCVVGAFFPAHTAAKQEPAAALTQ